MGGLEGEAEAAAERASHAAGTGESWLGQLGLLDAFVAAGAQPGGQAARAQPRSAFPRRAAASEGCCGGSNRPCFAPQAWGVREALTVVPPLTSHGPRRRSRCSAPEPEQRSVLRTGWVRGVVGFVPSLCVSQAPPAAGLPGAGSPGPPQDFGSRRSSGRGHLGEVGAGLPSRPERSGQVRCWRKTAGKGPRPALLLPRALRGQSSGRLWSRSSGHWRPPKRGQDGVW